MTKKFEIPKKDPFILNSKNLKNFKKNAKIKKQGIGFCVTINQKKNFIKC